MAFHVCHATVSLCFVHLDMFGWCAGVEFGAATWYFSPDMFVFLDESGYVSWSTVHIINAVIC